MDALKLIPQVFFDAIARVVPGGTALALLFTCVPWVATAWQKLLHVSQGMVKEPSTVFSSLSILVCAYAIGHVVSPMTKGIQRVGEWLLPRTEPKDGKSRSEKYDWLRVYAPDAGAHCAKLRAEFTMYNSLAAVFLLAFFISACLTAPASLGAQFAFVLLSVGMAYRGYEGADTFAKSINTFYAAANERPVTSHIPFRKPKP
jgi:hypothetical protein